jgi:hypothetical protein
MEMSDVLRDAVRKCGKRKTTIATATGVSAATLSEFMDGADLRLSHASQIAAYLGLELKSTVVERATKLNPRGTQADSALAQSIQVIVQGETYELARPKSGRPRNRRK